MFQTVEIMAHTLLVLKSFVFESFQSKINTVECPIL